jgi:isopenicillin-N N-acyltransferase-like protein
VTRFAAEDGGLAFVEVEADGSHRQVGELIGEAARGLIQEGIAYYEEHHEVMAGMSFRDAERESLPYLAQARRWVPQIVDELEGMAAGSGVPVSKLAVPNLGEEFTCSDEAALLGVASTGNGEHCTTFAVMAGGRKLAGHNEDWYSGDAGRNVLLRMCMTDGTRIVAITPACLLAASGINSRGVATGANTVFCTDVRLGVPNNFIRRWMLEADSAETARARALLPARARGCNHLLADVHGRIWDVETSATASVTFESGSWLVHTNHYLHESMLPYEMSRLPLESSRARHARASDLLEAGLGDGGDPFEVAQAVLADHHDEGLEICNHEDETLRPGERQSTTASMVWDLDAMVAHVCAGPPCENPRVGVALS